MVAGADGAAAAQFDGDGILAARAVIGIGHVAELLDGCHLEREVEARGVEMFGAVADGDGRAGGQAGAGQIQVRAVERDACIGGAGGGFTVSATLSPSCRWLSERVILRAHRR